MAVSTYLLIFIFFFCYISICMLVVVITCASSESRAWLKLSNDFFHDPPKTNCYCVCAT